MSSVLPVVFSANSKSQRKRWPFWRVPDSVTSKLSWPLLEPVREKTVGVDRDVRAPVASL